MSRLIDADELQSEYKKYHDGKRSVLIDVAPTIDAVEVIRCKDCKYKNLSDICEYFDVNAGNYTLWHHVEDNDFCSKAERRSDETD